MSKRIILNDNEVVTNEDVSVASDWVRQDLGRSLEGLLNGFFDTNSSVVVGGVPGTTTMGAVISGLEVTTSSVDLKVTVSSGSVLARLASYDIVRDSPYRVGTLEGLTILSVMGQASITRWDVIEVSIQETTSSETRKVLTSVGTTNTLVDTVVDKIKTTSVLTRVRPGSGFGGGAPRIQPDPAWLPIALVEVLPGVLTLDTSRVIDLRKFLGNSLPSSSSFSALSPDVGAVTPSPSFFTDGELVRFGNAQVRTSGYLGSLSTSVNTFPSPSAAGTFSLTSALTSAPSVSLSDVSSDSIPPSSDSWTYMYAYRPTKNCGYTSICMSSVPPHTSFSLLPDTLFASRPSKSFSPPLPFHPDDIVTPDLAVYLGAVLLFDTGGGVLAPKTSFKSGGYTKQTYSNAFFLPSTLVEISGEATLGSSSLSHDFGLETSSPASSSGTPLLPASASAVRVAVELYIIPPAAATTFSFKVLTSCSPGMVLASGLLSSSASTVAPYPSFKLVEVDVPTNSCSKSLTVEISNPGVPLVRVITKVLGYYEAT